MSSQRRTVLDGRYVARWRPRTGAIRDAVIGTVCRDRLATASLALASDLCLAISAR